MVMGFFVTLSKLRTEVIQAASISDGLIIVSNEFNALPRAVSMHTVEHSTKTCKQEQFIILH